MITNLLYKNINFQSYMARIPKRYDEMALTAFSNEKIPN